MGKESELFVGVQVTLGSTAGERRAHTPSLISRDHHVTRSVLYLWRRQYQERGEAVLGPMQAFGNPSEVTRPQNAQEQIAHLGLPLLGLMMLSFSYVDSI